MSTQELLKVDTITVLYVILILMILPSHLTVVSKVVRRDGFALMMRMSLISVLIRLPPNASEVPQMGVKMKRTGLATR